MLLTLSSIHSRFKPVIKPHRQNLKWRRWYQNLIKKHEKQEKIQHTMCLLVFKRLRSIRTTNRLRMLLF